MSEKKIDFKNGSKGYLIVKKLQEKGIKVNGLVDKLLEEAQKV